MEFGVGKLGVAAHTQAAPVASDVRVRGRHINARHVTFWAKGYCYGAAGGLHIYAGIRIWPDQKVSWPNKKVFASWLALWLSTRLLTLPTSVAIVWTFSCSGLFALAANLRKTFCGRFAVDFIMPTFNCRKSMPRWPAGGRASAARHESWSRFAYFRAREFPFCAFPSFFFALNFHGMSFKKDTLFTIHFDYSHCCCLSCCCCRVLLSILWPLLHCFSRLQFAAIFVEINFEYFFLIYVRTFCCNFQLILSTMCVCVRQ